ncbi:MAG: helix-turn-helix domain-containing protein [Bernardetiaceae bacterium]
MDARDIKKLARRGEDSQTEFKLKVYYPHKILREIVAFANTEGGFLLIGIADNGQIKGVKNPEGEIFELERALKKYCQPLPTYTIHRVPVPEEREVVVFQIAPAAEKPVYLLPQKLDQERVVYVRSEDKSIQASREMKRILRDSSRNRHVLIQIGEHERTLLNYLSEKKRINLETYAELTHLPKRIASAILVKLTLANVIEIKPQEGGYDFFVEAI